MLKPLKKSSWRKHPSIPPGLRLYVVADVHGNADALRDVFSRIDADMAPASARRIVQVFLGDYIDRGPASSEVLTLLITRQIKAEMVLLKGNHEAMLLRFLRDPQTLGDWRQNGGLQTLISYGLKPSLNPQPEERRELGEKFATVFPDAHRSMISKLLVRQTCGDFFFAHAGVRPGVPLQDQREDDMLWIREDFLFYEGEFGKVIVHGHTPVRQPEIHHNRINLDVGAYATGKLACMVIDGQTIEFI
jgi:serine/threonine protein phosphatase 1